MAALQYGAGTRSPFVFLGPLIPPTSPLSRSLAADRLETPPRHSWNHGGLSKPWPEAHSDLQRLFGHEQQGVIPATKAWVCCTILIFLCWMHSWLGGQSGSAIPACVQRVSGAWGGGQGAVSWTERGVEQSSNKSPRVFILGSIKPRRAPRPGSGFPLGKKKKPLPWGCAAQH